MNGDNASAIIDPSDTYFEIYVIAAQIAAIIKPTCQLRANMVPTPDATDLPPVKFKKIDLECPNITAMDDTTGNNPISLNVLV